MEKLRNELTFHLAAEAARIGFWERDLVTDQVTHCSVTASILGWEPDHVTCSAQDLENIILAEDLPLFGSSLHAAIISCIPFDLEFRIRRRNGDIRWLAIRGVGICDAQNKPAKATGVMFDITERKQVEQAMHDTQIRYHLATEAANIGTWEQDIVAGVTHISPTTARVLGLPATKTFLRKEEWQAMIVPEDLPKTSGLREQSLRSGQPFNIELRYKRPDSKIIWVAVRGLLELDKDGHPRRSLGIMQDITEVKQAEEILRANEGRFRSLTEYSPDAILVDLDGTFVYANSCAVKLFDAESANDILGRSIQDFIESEFQPLVLDRRNLILEDQQKPALVELKMRRLNGTSVDVQAICGKVLWEGRSAIQVMLRDITELKRAQEKLRISSERLKLVIEGTGEGIWEWDIMQACLYLLGRHQGIAGGAERRCVRNRSRMDQRHPSGGCGARHFRVPGQPDRNDAAL